MKRYSFEAIRRGRVTKLWDYGWALYCCYRVEELEPSCERPELFRAFMADRVFRDLDRERRQA